jgi:hypothetical protein
MNVIWMNVILLIVILLDVIAPFLECSTAFSMADTKM